MHYAYISIQGKHFDPVAFQQELPAEISGVVKSFRRERDGVAKCWKSTEYLAASASESPKVLEKISALMTRLHIPLSRLKSAELTISLEYVIYCKTCDDINGVYFPSDLVEMLAKIGGYLDVDIVRHPDLIWVDGPGESLSK